MPEFLCFFRSNAPHSPPPFLLSKTYSCFPLLLKEHEPHFDLSLHPSQTACEGINFTKSLKTHSIVSVIGLPIDQESLLKVQLAS